MLPGALFGAAAKWYNKRCARQRVRPEDYERFVGLMYGDAHNGGAMVVVNLTGLQHPLHARAGTPDAVEIGHAVIREAYGKYLPSGEVCFVVDAGAYIGDATAWYLSRFPSCRVVALEPTADTFAMLHNNCAPYGERIRMINGALCYDDGFLERVSNPITSTGNSVAENPDGAWVRCQPSCGRP